MIHWLRAGLSAAALLGLVNSASAQELVVNGDFSDTSLSRSGQFSNQVTGWTTEGYNFLFFGATSATSKTATGSDPNLSLWGTYGTDGSTNGFTDSPNGGNFVGADGAYEVGAISQTILGLVAGQTYALSFEYAAAQQSGYTGDTTEKWDVSLGTTTIDTSVIQNPNHSFSGWYTDTFTYTATAASEVLSFLAVGTPNGEPPFVLLDGVSLQATSATDIPEPSSLILIVGFAMAGVAHRLRGRSVRRSTASA